MNNWTSRLLWTIYIALLAVLLPHTAWAFGQFEPPGWQWLGWVAAIAFEGAIAALTWRLKQRIEEVPNRGRWQVRFSRRYCNVYAVGLLVAIGVSSLANWSHAVEYGFHFAAFTAYHMPPLLYSLTFGAILPVCSLLFAHILADTTAADQEENEELKAANVTIRELRQEVRVVSARADLAEQRFRAIGDLAILLTGEDKRQRILAARQQWPQLPAASVAVIADASRSYVSEVLSAPEPVAET